MNKKEILKKIETGKIKMKPKWEFRVKEMGVEGVVLISVAMAAVAMAAVYYFVKRYDPREWLPFGEIGWQVFLSDFPYYWLGINIGLVILGVILWSKVGENYKKTWGKLAVTIIGVTLVLSIGLVLFRGF